MDLSQYLSGFSILFSDIINPVEHRTRFLWIFVWSYDYSTHTHKETEMLSKQFALSAVVHRYMR